MLRKIFSISLITLLISSCGNTGKKEAVADPIVSDETVKVEFASLVNNPSEFVGKTISVEGKVVHVCKHSGKKLFITGENPDVMLYIQAGEDMPKFPMELLGSEVVVEGKLTPVAVNEMPEGEGQHQEKHAAEAPGTDTCSTEQALTKQTALADLMMVYNKHSVVK